MTVQKQGPGPDVKASGTGLAATATIGGVRVTFDGVKIIAGR